MSRSSGDHAIAISNTDGNVVMPINNEVKQQQAPQKSNFWVGTMVGGVTALTVTTAFAGYLILAVRKQSSGAIHNATTAVIVKRFSFDWWRHRLSTIVHPISESSADILQLQQQQQQQQQEAAATTANIVNTSVQTAIEQFQKELQSQLIHDRNQSTIQFLNTMQQQERTLTQTLGQPIHSTKQQMNVLQQQIQALQQIFMSPKSRGTFGEVQLELLIKDVLPATMYTMQFTLSNKKRVDCMLHLPSPIGNISIDSKFPTLTTNITTTTDTTNDNTFTATSAPAPSTSASQEQQQQQQQQQLRKKEIRDKLHKHINDIASKYILPGETSPHAICFIPSASLFLDIVTDHSDILLYAHRQNVWLTCPTTLLAVLTSIQGISRGQVVAQQTTNIFALITKLNKDIDLLVNRFEMAEKSVERTRTELTKMQTSVHKIQKVRMELDSLSQSVTSSSPVMTPSLQVVPHKRTNVDEYVLSTDTDDMALNNMKNDDSITMQTSNTIPPSVVMLDTIVDDSERQRHMKINGDH